MAAQQIEQKSRATLTEAPERADFPHPWTDDSDQGEWKVAGKSKDGPSEPLGAVIAVRLDPEQKEWVFAQARRTGLSLIDVMRRLVDDARAREAAEEQSAR